MANIIGRISSGAPIIGKVSGLSTEAALLALQALEARTADAEDDISALGTGKANTGDVYPKTQTYTKTETDNAVGTRAPQASTYTKTENDTALALKADKIRATNLVTNGDFSQGVTGWIPYNEQSVVDGEYRLMGDGSGRFIYTEKYIPLKNSKYYASVKMKVNSSDNLETMGFHLLGDSGGGIYNVMYNMDPIDNTWHRESFVVDISDATGTLLIFRILGIYATPIDSAGKIVSIEKVQLIDLTATFGAGNEPTKEQMDALLLKYPNSWFDGTKDLVNVSDLMNGKADKIQEGWITPTLLNGWTNESSHPVRYYKDQFGIVRFKGILNGVTNNTHALSLPSGYIPSGYPEFVKSNGVGGIVIVKLNFVGGFVVSSSSLLSYISLDGITFRAEA